VTDGGLWLILMCSTVALAGIAILLFQMCERVARARGLIDWKTNY
jgi:hypothetical protein